MNLKKYPYRLRRFLFRRYRTLRLTNIIKNNKLFDNKEILYCELGVNEGLHALTVLHNLPIKHAYLVDIFASYTTHTGETSNYEEGDIRMNNCKNNLKKYNNKISIFKDDIHKIHEKLPNDFNYIYYDCDELGEGVSKMLDEYFPKLAVGGYISGHGFRASQTNHAKAVLDFVEKTKNAELSGICNEWWIKKIDDKKNKSI